jgi:hypothetical protein
MGAGFPGESVRDSQELRQRHCWRLVFSTLIFFVGLLLASLSYFSAQPRAFIDALISWLQSPAANPQEYLFATGGTAVSGLLLAPVALMFYRRLTAIHAFAAIGSFFLAAGLLAAVLIGCLAPFPQTYEPLDIPLAYAAFISIATGLAVCLAVAAMRARQSPPRSDDAGLPSSSKRQMPHSAGRKFKAGLGFRMWRASPNG